MANGRYHPMLTAFSLESEYKDLTNRLERLGGTLSQGIVPESAAQPESLMRCTFSTSHSISAKPPATVYAGLLLCQSRDHSGLPFFTREDELWITSRTDVKPDFGNLMAVYKNQRIMLRTLSHSRIQEATDHVRALPPRDVV